MHDGNREFGYYLAQRRGGRGNEWDGEVVTRLDPVEHPVVRVHPETGRRGIFVNPGFTSHIVGVSEAESRAILDLLYAHLTKPEHIVRHRWRAGRRGDVGQPQHRPLRQPRLRHRTAGSCTGSPCAATSRSDRPDGTAVRSAAQHGSGAGTGVPAPDAWNY